MKAWISVAGQSGFVDSEEARVSAFDHGFTVADGVFETLKVESGRALALSRHLDRLESSAKAFLLPQLPRDEIHVAVLDLLDRCALPLGRLRITVTSGVGPLGSARGDALPTVVIALAEAQPWPDLATAIFVPWVRNERSAVAGLKTTSYAENVLALRWALEEGFDEGLFLNTRGEVSEGTGTNIFAVFGSEVVTPPLTSGCLAGITRGLLLETITVTERNLSLEEVHSADELFLSSSTREVQPVRALGARTWTSAGPVTLATREALRIRFLNESDPP